ncbi:hypothetical protein BO94DRAFT_577635 [Aspergillus sclerotioniger CBS 115572]|uniref:Uncharacterized protein n=1 Tax=Aspergillus sclerotioniger CBS 115572 TaxID=1450535 RepID=A0A317VWE5_9EURO|nr:hypothetical protein BO94DRAFT_577635 [Aspergillus sclerotioniger CBS 115572]PWY77312.1 hypothetical protein BO94DRAFT_577635 [Aspergillus sclerotioniger CBS 115572]
MESADQSSPQASSCSGCDSLAEQRICISLLLNGANIPYILWGNDYLNILGISERICGQNVLEDEKCGQSAPDWELFGSSPPRRHECQVKGEINDTMDLLIEDEAMEKAKDVLWNYMYPNRPGTDESSSRYRCRYSDKQERYITPSLIPDYVVHLEILPDQVGTKHPLHPAKDKTFHADICLYYKSKWLWNAPPLPQGVPSVRDSYYTDATESLFLPHTCGDKFRCILRSDRKPLSDCPILPVDSGLEKVITPDTKYKHHLGRHPVICNTSNNVLIPARFLECLHYLWVRDREIFGGFDYWSNLIERFFEITFRLLPHGHLLVKDSFDPMFYDWMGEQVKKYRLPWQEELIKDLGEIYVGSGRRDQSQSGTGGNGSATLETLRANLLAKGSIPLSPFCWMPRNKEQRQILTCDPDEGV